MRTIPLCAARSIKQALGYIRAALSRFSFLDWLQGIILQISLSKRIASTICNSVSRCENTYVRANLLTQRCPTTNVSIDHLCYLRTLSKPRRQCQVGSNSLNVGLSLKQFDIFSMFPLRCCLGKKLIKNIAHTIKLGERKLFSKLKFLAIYCATRLLFFIHGFEHVSVHRLFNCCYKKLNWKHKMLQRNECAIFYNDDKLSSFVIRWALFH